MLREETWHLDVLPSDILKNASYSSLSLDTSYKYCLNLFASHAKSFHFASRYLDPIERRSLAALYGFCRLADDFVDEVDLTEQQIEWELNQLTELVNRLTEGETFNHPLFHAFGDTLNRYQIPVKYLHELIEGVRTDVSIKEYETVSQLDQYCYRVASTVGIMMCHIWERTNPETLERAADLGLAMQLTNILRDVAEDFDKGRIYLPLELRDAFRVTQQDFIARRVGNNFKSLLKHEIARARAYYTKAEVALQDLPPAAAFTVKVAGRVYSDILNRIEKMNYQVFKRRAYVPKWRKLLIAYRSGLEYKRDLKYLESDSTSLTP